MLPGDYAFLAPIADALIQTADGAGESALGFRTLEAASHVRDVIAQALGQRNALDQYEIQVRTVPLDAAGRLMWAVFVKKH